MKKVFLVIALACSAFAFSSKEESITMPNCDNWQPVNPTGIAETRNCYYNYGIVVCTETRECHYCPTTRVCHTIFG